MNAAEVRLAGRVTAHPTVSVGERGDRVTFRILSTERRFVPDTREWVDGDQFGVTVVCWGPLATAVIGLVRKGDPVVVLGRISSRQFERSAGGTDYWTEIRADMVALDLARGGANRWTRRPHHDRAASGDPGGGGTVTTAGAADLPTDPWADRLDEIEPPADAYDHLASDDVEPTPAPA